MVTAPPTPLLTSACAAAVKEIKLVAEAAAFLLIEYAPVIAVALASQAALKLLATWPLIALFGFLLRAKTLWFPGEKVNVSDLSDWTISGSNDVTDEVIPVGS